MRPAFDSPRQAAAFTMLLLLLLAAPWLTAKTSFSRQAQTYSAESIRWENYPWIQKTIFEETNDIDIAFIGSSHMTLGIDTPYVQQQLDERLGRKTVVRSVSWLGGGYDELYFAAKELLAHRRVKTLVFYDESSSPKADEPNDTAPHWFRYGDDGGLLAGLPLRQQSVYYFAAVIGMPRNLLNWVIPGLPEDPNRPIPTFAETRNLAVNPETRLGSVSAHLGFDPDFMANTNFVVFVPQTGTTSADFRMYQPGTNSSYVFSNRPLPDWQIFFARQFARLAQRQGCHLVLLHLPEFTERSSPVMVEARDWPGLCQTDMAMMGIPPGRLFAGLSEGEVKLLYADPGHLNENGQRYFTRLIAPGLIQYYESCALH